MKKVILQKRKFSWKDLLRIIIIVMLHYFGFYIFFGISFTAHFLINNSFFPDLGSMTWVLFYCCILAPSLNAVLHIIYSEAGSPWTRGIMWLHSLFVAAVVLISLFF